ncbi:MAG: MBL fold metallo-hydrolase [Pseudomonadota bacterium]
MPPASVTLMGVKGGPAIRPGSSMPTSILVRMGGQTILVDAGLGVTRGLCDQGVALTGLDAVFVTHLHSDHYLELGPLFHTAWTAGLTRPVPVIGSSGLDDYWRHFQAAMAFDTDLRIADEGRVPLGPLMDLSTITGGQIWRRDGLVVTALRNHHPPIEESFALRFEADGKVFVFSGDTAPMPEMVAFAKGADLLVHEAILPDGVDALCARMPNGDERLRQHILRSHTTAQDAGQIAEQAGVGRLVLTHFVPDGDPDFPPSAYKEAAESTWAGPLSIANDGLHLVL